MEILGFALGPVLVTILRLLIPFIIFRWPFWGGVATALVDALDVIIVSLLQLGEFGSYHRTDKILDSYFLVFMAYYSWRHWRGLEQKISLGLFIWRMIGFVLFEITGIRWLFLVFPNLFLWWWLLVAGRDHFKPNWNLTPKVSLQILGIMLGPKMLQEMILHFWQLKPVQIMSDFARDLFEF